MQASCFFAPSMSSAIFRFLLFLQGFHHWTLNPFHMVGVQAFLRRLIMSIHGATVENTLYEMVTHRQHLEFTPPQQKRHIL